MTVPGAEASSPDTLVTSFQIKRRQFLDPEGEPCAPLPRVAEDSEFLASLYRGMALTRAFDAKCVSLQRTGRLGTFATALGQEAVPVGSAAAMRPSDVLVPAYREGGAQIWRGVKMEELLVYWGGDERGHAYADPAVAQDFPVCITVGNHALHAAGVATAFKLRGEERAALCTIGDGATSKGDVYEALNVAGVWALPLVVVITNNRWAISTPLDRQTGAETLAQKGIAGGVHVLQADGNDVLAVHSAVGEALERARGGGGASLIECLTYRLNDHNTADDASRYRDPEEVKRQWAKCPIKRMRGFLEKRGLWSEAREDAMQAEIAGEIDEAVNRFLNHPAPPPESMFDHLHAVLPDAYQRQRQELMALADA
jgi:pyruvate dehydrogenase E1 component alpha subunit